VAGALAAAGCGGEREARHSSENVRPPNLPPSFNLQSFDCTEWNRSDERIRRYVIRRLREIVGGQITGRGAQGHGTTLDDTQAYQLFESGCADPRARGFVLYKLYGHAAGFAGGPPPY
jgi:hypothetical protein